MRRMPANSWYANRDTGHGLNRNMNLAQFVQKWARATPTRPAVALGRYVLQNYQQLGQRVACLAGGLVRSGLSPGDRVGLLMRNVPQYFECLFACWHAGFAAVPINAKLHPNEFGYILDHSGSALCLASPGLSAAAGCATAT